MGFLERDHVIDLEFPWIGRYPAGIGAYPEAVDNLSLPFECLLHSDRDQTFLDKAFLAGVLVVFVGIDPVFVETPVVGLDLLLFARRVLPATFPGWVRSSAKYG